MSAGAPITNANGAEVKPPPVTLRNLAARLCPNPAFTVEGTLQVILDGIEKLDDDALARALCRVTDRMHGRDTGPITDEQWNAEDVSLRTQLLLQANVFKAALREMTK